MRLAFSRLAINGLGDAGMQPFLAGDGKFACLCNGEIYNHVSIEAEHSLLQECASGSDCECLLPLWCVMKNGCVTAEEAAVAFARSLDGVFAIVLVDVPAGLVLVARDPYGVRPLFETLLPVGGRAWASEIKALAPLGASALAAVAPVPPGTVSLYALDSGAMLSRTAYHAVPWLKLPSLADPASSRIAVRAALEAAVNKRLMSERPVGCLLSGGLDSSLIAALVAARLRALGAPRLRTFSIGMSAADGTDLAYARLVAEHIGSDHTEVRARMAYCFPGSFATPPPPSPRAIFFSFLCN